MKFLGRKKEFQIQNLELKIQEISNQLNLERQRNQDLQDVIYNTSPLPIPIWKVFHNFLTSKRDLNYSDQFQIQEKDDKSFYSITFLIRNGKNNSYSKGRGGNGLLSDWHGFREDITNTIEYLDPELAKQIEEKRLEGLKLEIENEISNSTLESQDFPF